MHLAIIAHRRLMSCLVAALVLVLCLMCIPHTSGSNSLNPANGAKHSAVRFGGRHHYCVFGAGPAGLQAAYLLQREGRDYVVVERESRPGSTFRVYPRHGTLLSINKRFTGNDDEEPNMRHDWNSLLSTNASLRMTKYSNEYFPQARDYVRYLGDFADAWRLNIAYDTTVTKVRRDASATREATVAPNGTTGPAMQPPGGKWTVPAVGLGRRRFTPSSTGQPDFVLDTNRGPLRCGVLLVGLGISRPVTTDRPGYDAMEGYETVTTNATAFRNQRVLILGNGNSAFELANHIANEVAFTHVLGRRQLRLAFMTHYAGDVRAINAGFVDRYMLKSLDATFELQASAMPDVTDDGRLKFPASSQFDRVVRCFGFRFDDRVFDDAIKPRPLKAKGGKYPMLTPEYQAVNVPGMYVIGAAAHGYKHDLGKSSGAFIHGFRYAIRAALHILAWNEHGTPWPSREVPLERLAEVVMWDRIARTSGLYQMFGVLADVVTFEHDVATLYHEVPLAYLMDTEDDVPRAIPRGRFMAVVTLEYGKGFKGCRVLSHLRAGNLEPKQAHKSNFLHPVTRVYSPEGELLGVHHTVEDLSVTWSDFDLHVVPLAKFLRFHAPTIRGSVGDQSLRQRWWSSRFVESLAATPLV